jgi:hypothetical protein
VQTQPRNEAQVDEQQRIRQERREHEEGVQNLFNKLLIHAIADTKGTYHKGREE